jgi:hypothetical protein
MVDTIFLSERQYIRLNQGGRRLHRSGEKIE